MNIQKIRLKNFRNFIDTNEVDLHPQFNLVVGINGTGKTAFLEGLRITLGSLFLQMNKVKEHIRTISIQTDDVRVAHNESQYPVEVWAKGNVLDYSDLMWKRELKTEGGKTRHAEAVRMKKISDKIQKMIQENDRSQNLPLVGYYGTERYKKEKSDLEVEPVGSRLRGYYNALDLRTNLQFFRNLFRTEAFAAQQKGRESLQTICITNSVKICIEDCEEFYHDISRDKLMVKIKDHEEVPFDYLSDGFRSMIAITMELSFRAFLLNDHLGVDAAKQTPGVVLIDEIDLHLHPAWQRKVIQNLQVAFPMLQFIATTHAPVVVASLRGGSIHALQDNRVYRLDSQFGKDANTVLLQMGAKEREPEIESRIEQYFRLIEKGHGNQKEAIQLRHELAELLGESDPELQRADIMLSFFD